MTCFTSGLVRLDETLIDEWGGSVYFIEPSADLKFVALNIKTPWGTTYGFVKVYLNEVKTYTSGDKTYSVEPVLIAESGGNYFAKFELCYVFIEKLNTICILTLDEARSSFVEGGKVYLDMSLKDQNDVELTYQIQIYKNGTYEWQVNPPWSYEHIVTAEEVGMGLVFQTKFAGTDGFNPSESPLVSVVIPDKIATTLSINVDKSTVNVDQTVEFTGTLKTDSGVPIPNMSTLYLVYKAADGGYGYVQNINGYKIIASTDGSGNYYRPWEPTENYLDQSIYAMFFEGNVTYENCYSPEIILNISINECIQNIKILVGEDNIPVTGVKLTIDSIVKTTDINGIAIFNLIKDKEYIVNISYLDYNKDKTFIACKFDPQILYITIEEPTIGKIEEQNISYDFVGEDEIEISVPVTNLSDEKYGFSLRLYDSNKIELDENGIENLLSLVPACWLGITPKNIESGDTYTFVIDSVGAFSPWNRYTIMGKNVLLTLNRGCTKDILDQVLLYVEEESVSNTGEIINISHGVDGDEVDFMITIKNTSDTSRTYHVELFDESSKSIDIEPDLLPPTLNSDETENIKLSSKLKSWTVMDVEGQILTFKLWSWAYPGNIFDKILSHTKQYPMEEVEIEEVECYIDNPFDKTKCLLTNEQATFLKWTAIGLGGLYVLSIGAPMIRGIGSAFEKSQK